MTESEAKGFVQGKLDCMEKCDVFNREDKHRNNECDNCEYCYSQGNFGEQNEAFQIAINALEKQEKIKKIIANANQWSKEDVVVKAQAFCDIEKILRSDTVERLRELVKWFYKKFPSGGFLHIVLDDGNFETRHIVWCLLHWKDYLSQEEIEWAENHENEVIEMCTLLLELKEKDRYKIWKE